MAVPIEAPKYEDGGFDYLEASPCLLYWEAMWSGDAMSRILRQRSVFIIGRPLIPEETAAIKTIQIAKDDKATHPSGTMSDAVL